jgi:hypothetical protein
VTWLAASAPSVGSRGHRRRRKKSGDSSSSSSSARRDKQPKAKVAHNQHHQPEQAEADELAKIQQMFALGEFERAFKAEREKIGVPPPLPSCTIVCLLLLLFKNNFILFFQLFCFFADTMRFCFRFYFFTILYF